MDAATCGTTVTLTECYKDANCSLSDLVISTAEKSVNSGQGVIFQSDKGNHFKTQETCHRVRKIKRPYSPECASPKGSSKSQRRKRKINKDISEDFDGVYEREPFSCAKCESPYVINPLHKPQPSDRKMAPRQAVDPETNRLMVLCNACGLAMSRANKKNKKTGIRSKHTSEKICKDKYLSEATEFAVSLSKSLNEPDVQRFVCPRFRGKPCGCLMEYLCLPDNLKDTQLERVTYLLELLRKARDLAKERDPEIKSVTDMKNSGENGKCRKFLSEFTRPRKRSKNYEDFVLKTREYLRNELKFCEQGCQQILLYSNNFLHKKSKSSPDRGARIEKTLGKRSIGLLKPIEDLANEKCCGNSCVVMATSHSKLLEYWRATANRGQKHARSVLAEMLTPSGGAKSNCYRFISLVTGCSTTTIAQVRLQMKLTKGDRTPPEHGLRKWWRDRTKIRIKCESTGSENTTNNDAVSEDNGSLQDKLIGIPCARKNQNVADVTTVVTEISESGSQNKTNTTLSEIPVLLAEEIESVIQEKTADACHLVPSFPINNVDGTVDDADRCDDSRISVMLAKDISTAMQSNVVDDSSTVSVHLGKENPSAEDISEISIPSAEELSALDREEALKRLLTERNKLLRLQKKLSAQSVSNKKTREKIIVSKKSGRKVVVPCIPVVPYIHAEAVQSDIINVQPQVLHIVQLPTPGFLTENQLENVTLSVEPTSVGTTIVSSVPQTSEMNAYQIYSVVDSSEAGIVYLSPP